MDKNYSTIIISTLREKLKETSIDKISVADICRDAGISRQSFYYHFTGINDCLYQMFLDDFNLFRTKIPSLSHINSVRDVLDHFYNYIYDNQVIIKNIVKSTQKVLFFNYLWNAMLNYIKRFLPKAIPESQLLPPDDINYIIEFYISCFLTSVVNWINKDFVTTPDFESVHFNVITEGSVKEWVNKFIAFNKRKAITSQSQR